MDNVRDQKKPEERKPGEEAVPVAQIFLRVDSAIDISRRSVYTIFDLCGDIGGTIEIIFILGFGLVATFSRSRYLAEML